MNALNKFTPYFLGLLRIIVGYNFIQHGTAKLLEFPISMTGGNGAVPLASLFGVGGVIEILFGALFLIGLFTRASAFILSGQMAVAYFMVHAAQGNVLFPIVNGGELAVIYCFVFLYFVFSGAGAFALDSKVCKK